MTSYWKDVNGRNWTVCSCLKAWLPVYQAELIRLGELKRGLDMFQTIGWAAASAGTHGSGGAWDDNQTSTKALQIAREMGAAKWRRTKAQGFDIGHGHGVLNGCPHAAPLAKAQVVAFKNGRNGLANNGRDDGPKPRQFPTWQDGIKWAKARQSASTKPASKPTPKTRTTTFEAATFNVKGGTSGFLSRVPIIRSRVMKQLPHFLLVQELPTSSRLLVSAAIKTKYRIAFYGHNKAQYVIRNRQGWVKVKGAAYSIGNGRHAAVVRYRHRHTGADIVIATPHPSWEHPASKARANEATKLVSILNRDFPGLPKLIGGDFNDSAKSTSTRPKDSFGTALKAAGFHDLYADVAGAKRHGEQYNTAHQYKTPIPHSGIHLDRFFGTSEFEGIEWTNDAHSGKRGADHWLVRMRISLRHPIKN